MNQTSQHQILSLQQSTKEIHAKNRKKNGYNVYMSWCFIEFNELDYEQKKDRLVEARIRTSYEYEEYEENISIASEPDATTVDILRLAARNWRYMSDDLKDAWRERATIINQLPIIGAFASIPQNIINNKDELVLISLTKEFSRFASTMHRVLKSSPCVVEGKKYKRFGKEVVLLGSQLFRNFFLNHLLQVTFFGSNYSSLFDHEIVHRTKATVIIHIASKARMVDIFECNQVRPFEYKKDNDETTIHTCSGKVILKEKNSEKDDVGYIMEEDRYDGTIVILMESGRECRMKRPVYDRLLRSWDVSHCNDDKYEIIEYNPIRIKVFKSGNCQMTLNKFKLSNDLKLILI